MNVAILGAGNIANSMACALDGLKGVVNAYAVGARDIERAEAFAKKWNFEKAYGSYAELVADNNIDLVYVATPHSHHFEHAMLCLEHGKPCLVEKAFTANAEQAKKLIAKSDETRLLVTEAIWTRYQPSKDIIRGVMNSGVLGEIKTLEADFSVDLRHIERMAKPELAGGALLDLGMYCLTFASMYFGDDIVNVESVCEKYETGVDGTSVIKYTYKDGKTAVLKTSMINGFNNYGMIIGTKGKLFVDNLNNPQKIIRMDLEGNELETYPIPKQINGYEYELLAALREIQNGNTECMEMPHSESIEIMEQMDRLRENWGVKFPFE